MCARITSIFSFPTHVYAHFAHELQNIFNVVTKQKQTETQNALCNFSESPHMCRSPDHMAWCIMRLVHFALYINGLWSAFVGVAGHAAYAFLACMGVERARA